MALTKEQILTLTCLKEVDVKGVGPQKIFAIGATIDDRGLEIKSYEDLAQLMSGMKEKAINKVTLSNLNDAYKVARKIMDASDQANIGLVGYYDEEFPDVLRKTVNEEGKLDHHCFYGTEVTSQLLSYQALLSLEPVKLLLKVLQVEPISQVNLQKEGSISFQD